MKNLYHYLFRGQKASNSVALLFILFSLFLLDSNSFAQQLTQGITYQGKLVENGLPFSGSQTILFELLDNTGNISWSETQTVNVQDGLYSVVLGNQTPLPSSVFTVNPNLNLRVTINGNVLSPNVPLRATPYAHSAGGVIRNSIGTLQIIDGTILPIDIASGGNDKLLGTNANGQVTWLDRATAVSASGIAGGDLTGTYPNPEIGSGKVDSDNILDGTITNADIAATAGIEGTKVNPNFGGQTISTTSKATTSSTVVTDLGTTLTTKDYVDNQVSSATQTDRITIDLNGSSELEVVDNSISSTKIENGTIANIDIAATAGIEGTKVNPNFGGQTISTTGKATTNSTISTDLPTTLTTKDYVDTEISNLAISTSTLSNGAILIGDGSNTATEVAVSGDATLDNTGLLIIEDDAVTSAKILDGEIATSDLADNSVTLAKLQDGTANQVFGTDNLGNPILIDQTTLATAINTDNQDLDLVGNSLNLTNDATPVDLSPYLDNTDAQDLSLTGTTLSLTNDGTPVDLSSINTDNQDLDLVGNSLSLTNDATPVDLSPYLDNTDAQDLSLTGTTLSLTNDGTPVDLSSINTDNQDLNNVLLQGNDAGGTTITNLPLPSATTDAATKDYVDTEIASSVTPNLDNDPTNEIQNLEDVLLINNDANGNSIINLVNPSNPQDAATKDYVDTQIISVSGTSSLTDGNIFVGNAGSPTDVSLSGDATLANTGVLTISNNAITSPKINNGAVTLSKLQNGSANQLFATDGSGLPILINQNTLSFTPNGAAGGDLGGSYPNPTILNNAITSPKINNGAVTLSKLQNGAANQLFATDGSGLPILINQNTLSFTPNGAAGGDLGGSYPNPTILNNAITSPKINNGAVTLSKLQNGAANQLFATDGSGLPILINQSSFSSPFTITGQNVFRNVANEKFIFGSNQMNDVVGTADDNRMFYDKATGAFRVGSTTGIAWDSRGTNSFAAGRNNAATGQASAIGGGENNQATASWSTVSGGTFNQATATTSSVGGGIGNIASGANSRIGGGDNNIASGVNSTVAGGWANQAIGDHSSILGGVGLTANSYAEAVVGMYNEDVAGSANIRVDTDQLFVIGNGTGISPNLSNALVVYKDATLQLKNLSAAPTTTAGRLYVQSGNLFFGTTNLSAGSPVYTATNGITKVGNDFRLGGILSASTDINMNGNGYSISNNVEGFNFFSINLSSGVTGSTQYTAAGGNLSLKAGDQSTTRTGGSLFLSGSSNDNGGAAGNGGSGDVRLLAGDADLGAGGAEISLGGGNTVFGRSNGGEIFIIAGDANGVDPASVGGEIFIQSGHRTSDNVYSPMILQSSGGNVGIGTSPTGGFRLDVNGLIRTTGAVNTTSDRRLKENILTLNNSLSNIQKLRGTSYFLKDKSHDKRLQFGVIAQEIEEVFPNLVMTDSDGYKSVSYSGFIPVLIEATKEQQTIIEAQQEKISKLEIQVQELKELVLLLKDENDSNSTLSKKVDALEKQLTSLVNQLSELTAQK